MPRNAATPEQQSVRVLKVGERVRHILSELLARGEVHDDVLTAHSVSVTEVRMTPDLRNAAAYVKPLLGEDEGAVLKALRTNTAFFQREVAKRDLSQFVITSNMHERKTVMFMNSDAIVVLPDEERVLPVTIAHEEVAEHVFGCECTGCSAYPLPLLRKLKKARLSAAQQR